MRTKRQARHSSARATGSRDADIATSNSSDGRLGKLEIRHAERKGIEDDQSHTLLEMQTLRQNITPRRVQCEVGIEHSFAFRACNRYNRGVFLKRKYP